MVTITVVRWRLGFAALCLEIYDPVLANSPNLEPEVRIPMNKYRYRPCSHGTVFMQT